MGNDRASGTYSRPGGYGSFSLSKTSDIPVGEITVGVGFGAGLLQTVAQFRPRLVASSSSQSLFKGRQVQESDGFVAGFDNCWFPGSTVPQLVLKGSSWNVGYYAGLEDRWVDDYIGWNTAQVNYYRTRLTPASFPCQAQRRQVMHILINGTSRNRTTYKFHDVSAKIYLDKVEVTRDSVTQTKPW